jgi:phosphosulfolactate synthase
MELAAEHVDVVRLGWGSALVTGGLERKLAAYRDAGVAPMLGGTLTELAFAHGRVEELVRALQTLGIAHVEVSEGTLDFPGTGKTDLIARLATEFTVFAEVGSKDDRFPESTGAWEREVTAALAAGATAVILEARVDGDRGIYRPDGTIREKLVDALVAAAGAERLIFEAPRRPQQIWLIHLLGADVNLGNVLPDDVIGLESLRLGLRAGTLTHFHPTGRA